MTDPENDPTPHVPAKLLATLSRRSRFFIAAPSTASADVWFVVESANPRRPVAPAHSSEAEAWRVAEEMNEREIKQRASEVRDLQREKRARWRRVIDL
jgi:hypothetical protein